MALISDVIWTCPECNTKNVAQIYRDDCEAPFNYELKDVPSGADLKHNEPCKNCGECILSDDPWGIIKITNGRGLTNGNMRPMRTQT